MPPLTPPLSGDATDVAYWRRVFDEPGPMTIGVEEELMVLDAETLDLVPLAACLADDAGDRRLRTELPAAQLELVTSAAPTVDAAIEELRALRSTAADLAAARGLTLAGAGVHPFARPAGEITHGQRYARILDEYGAGRPPPARLRHAPAHRRPRC